MAEDDGGYDPADPDWKFERESDDESDDSSVRPAPKPLENPNWDGDTRETLRDLDRLVDGLSDLSLIDTYERENNFLNLKSALRRIPAPEREYLVGLIQAPETSLLTLNRDNASSVIYALSEVPGPERAAFVRLITNPATRLLTDDRANAPYLIDALRLVPTEEQEALILLITDPATRLVRDDRDNALDLIYILKRVPVAERRDRVIRARNHMDLPPNHPGFNERLRQLVETPLDVPIPPLGGGMAAAAVQGGYAFGINVHDAGRDASTTVAYRRLLEAQRDVSSSTIQSAYEDFMRALDGLTDEALKRKVRVALGLEAASGGGFGGLSVGRITSCGLNTNYQDLIGRLWHFASTYVDLKARTPEAQAREQENARRSLFGALADSIERDGHLVCNPGKLQRIAVGVLQGRLAGVSIDGSVVEESKVASAASGIEPPLDNDATWQMFETTKPFREPFSAQSYRERAEAFIRENPRVDAPWLSEEVERYIKDPLNGLVEEEEDGALAARGGGAAAAASLRSGAGGPLAGVVARAEVEEERRDPPHSTPYTGADELLARQLDKELNGVEDGGFGAGGGRGDRAEEEPRPDVNPLNPGAAGGGGARARQIEQDRAALEAYRRLRAEQDEAYQTGLAADQAREAAKAEAERMRAEEEARDAERARLGALTPEERRALMAQAAKDRLKKPKPD